MTARLDIDLHAALDHALGAGRGLAHDDVAASAARLADVGAWAAAERAAGRLDLLDLPLDEAPAERVLAWRKAAPDAADVVLVGIGGSALSARVVDALRPAGESGPRLHVVDTVDPLVAQQLVRTLDPAAACLIAISKSGTTVETTAVFLVLEAWLDAALGAAGRARVAVVCGAGENPLRTRARERGYACFDLPAGVGGRFSALTPVGLLPAACVGVDPRALLRGAAAARERCLEGTLADNPALALAAAHHAAEAAGRKVAVLWPYGEALRPLGPWWAQLVGESLGKPGPSGPTGVTPLAARGPADQHSLLQLLVEGPDDKLTVFVEARGEDGPLVPSGQAPLCAASGRSLGALLRAECEATRFALREAGRPTVTVRLAAADASCVGAFLMTWELAVVYWARLLGVDPFGQPGVQLGKSAARAILTGEPRDVARRIVDPRIIDCGRDPS